MAEGKKSIIIYAEWGNTFDNLTDEEAGKLIKHFFDYVRDRNPIAEDRIVKIAFEQIKGHLKRDLDKWEQQLAQRKLAGQRSAEIRKQHANEYKQKSTTVNERSISSTDNVNVNVNVDVLPIGNINTSSVMLDAVAPKKEISEDQDSYNKFNTWLSQFAPNVLKMKEPITCEQLVSLKKDYSLGVIKDIFLKMHNYKPLLTKNVSANLTFRNWSKREQQPEPLPAETRKITGFKQLQP